MSESVTEWIKRHRKNLKVSQRAIAHAVGISRQAVQQWETGNTQPSSENLLSLGTLFNEEPPVPGLEDLPGSDVATGAEPGAASVAVTGQESREEAFRREVVAPRLSVPVPMSDSEIDYFRYLGTSVYGLPSE